MTTLPIEDTAGSPSRRRPHTWRSFFIAPWTSLRPSWTAFWILSDITLKPAKREFGNLFQGFRFFEQMSGSRNYFQFFGTCEPRERVLIQSEDRLVVRLLPTITWEP